MFRPILYRAAVALCCLFLLCCCAGPKATNFSDAEISLIRGRVAESSPLCGSSSDCAAACSSHDCAAAELSHDCAAAMPSIVKDDAIMRVLTIESADDEAVLRAKSTFLSAEALMSCDYALLCRRMVATVTHPSQDGVGIAGPQVGLNRRVVAVQRFDKEGEPFEVYANISIVETSGEKVPGGEGCLSVPDMRGDVERYQDIVIEYDRIVALDCGSNGCGSGGCDSGDGGSNGCGSNNGGSNGCGSDGCAERWKVERTRERVTGFTAVIFQHECDHLDGVLYIDRI